MKNVLCKKNNKNMFFDLLLLIIVVLIIEYIGFHIAVLNVDTSKKTNVYDFINSISYNIKEKPLNIGHNNSKVLDKVRSYQPRILMLIFFIVLMMWSKSGLTKGEFSGNEHGSAQWATTEIKRFKKDNSGAIIGEKLWMPLKSKNYNLNQLVIGGSGSGKTFRKIKPDILQANSSYIITDIKGEIYRDTSNYLRSKGYSIRVLNLIEPKYSMKFNPFMYIREDKDILILADTFIKNTDTGQKQSTSNDSFWTKAEFALLQALMYYVYKELSKEEWSFSSIIELLKEGLPDKNVGGKSVLDYIFDELAERSPDHIALKTYKVFKMAAPETSASILIGLSVRFGIFTTDDMEILTSADEMDIGSLGEERTAIYVMIPDTHRAFDVISAMFFSQMFQYLIYKADFEFKGSLPIHCRVMMDEFVNCGIIPYFDNMISTIRSREISTTIIIQDLSQLKAKYKDNWQTIIGCCDTFIFMGSPENETREYVNKLLGKTTVQQNSKSISIGSKGSKNESINFIQRDLMTSDELRIIPDKNQIVIIRSTNPIFCLKYVTEKSNKYKFMSNKADYRKVNDFRISDKISVLMDEYNRAIDSIV